MIALVNGKRRKGKSTLAFFLAQVRAKARFVWDPNQNFKSPEFVICYSTEDMEAFLERVQASQEGLFGDDEKPRDEFTLVYVPPEDFTQDDFDAFSKVIRKWMSGTYAVIIDESDEEIQNKSKMSKALAWWIRRSPQDEPEVVHVIQATHSPQDVYIRARNLLTDVYVFQTDGIAELDWFETYTQNPEIREIIRRLPHRHVLHYSIDNEGNGVIEILSNPAEWYVNIGSNRAKQPLEKLHKKGA